MAYNISRRWRRDEISVTLLDQVSEGAIATIQVKAGGASLFIMGEIQEDGQRLVVNGVHVSSQGVAPNDVGPANLREIAQSVMEIGNYDEIIVAGAIRSTGANPGRKPRRLRFVRDREPAPERKPD